ncbi:SAP30-binding protein [Ischnura elegans]|uniref:SAP30-binding protein n=1 Tax=Ischnura elegans TaxID=197161 RepID=UPI001ED878EF|nr:SAP30-binding protein [Ischnura elegans]
MSVHNQTSSFALASLTATYTDSEGEEEGAEEEEEDPEAVEKSRGGTPGSSGNSNVSAFTPPVVVKSNVLRPTQVRPARLVSYHDDTLISDEEGVPGEENLETDHVEINVVEMTVEEKNGHDENQGQGTKDFLLEEEEDGVIIPPEPPGKCPVELQEKIMRLHDRMLAGGLDMNRVIQQRKDFRNPSIYEKLIQFCGINEMGTNYDASVYDPQRWGKESFYEELAKVQKAEMDRRERERREKAKVEYVSGTARKGGAVGAGAVVSEPDDGKNKRKSKWDQVGAGVGGAVGAVHLLKPAGLIQAPAVGTSVTSAPVSSSTQPLSSLTTSITGTKGTVISAFGSLPKKPRV